MFVQTNRPDGNTIVSYWRSPDGSLHRVHEFRTGGLGGAEVEAPVDALASQGSLVYDGDHRLLFAVNAGSDSVTVFRVFGALLVRTQVLPSGGSFPTSIAVHDDLAYVLNAGGEGVLQGYELPAAGCARSPARPGRSASPTRRRRSSARRRARWGSRSTAAPCW